MESYIRGVSKKPAAVMFTQILIYLAAAVNLVNGIFSLGSEGIEKKILSLAMIILGIAAIWVAAFSKIYKTSKSTIKVGNGGSLVCS